MNDGIRAPRDSERCTAVRAGKRCKKWAMTGLTVCRIHGGATKASKQKSERAKTVSKMERFAMALPADSPLNDPIAGFEAEYRRTYGRILWYDEELAKLSKDELTWGLTKHEDKDMTGGDNSESGTVDTYEARANTLHELQFRERTHLLAMQKIYIGAKLDEKKLNIQRAYVMALDKAIIDVLSALGHDTMDPAIRQVVRDRLAMLPMRQS